MLRYPYNSKTPVFIYDRRAPESTEVEKIINVLIQYCNDRISELEKWAVTGQLERELKKHYVESVLSMLNGGDLMGDGKNYRFIGRSDPVDISFFAGGEALPEGQIFKKATHEWLRVIDKKAWASMVEVAFSKKSDLEEENVSNLMSLVGDGKTGILIALLERPPYHIDECYARLNFRPVGRMRALFQINDNRPLVEYCPTEEAQKNNTPKPDNIRETGLVYK